MEKANQPPGSGTGFRSEFFQGIMRLMFQDHPHVARQVERDLEEYRKAVKEGRWKPLR